MLQLVEDGFGGLELVFGSRRAGEGNRVHLRFAKGVGSLGWGGVAYALSCLHLLRLVTP